MPHFRPFLLLGLQNHEQHQVCAVAVGVVGDLCRALEGRILPYCDELITLLMQNLQASAHHRTAPCARASGVRRRGRSRTRCPRPPLRAARALRASHPSPPRLHPSLSAAEPLAQPRREAADALRLRRPGAGGGGRLRQVPARLDDHARSSRPDQGPRSKRAGGRGGGAGRGAACPPATARARAPRAAPLTAIPPACGVPRSRAPSAVRLRCLRWSRPTTRWSSTSTSCARASSRPTRASCRA